MTLFAGSVLLTSSIMAMPLPDADLIGGSGRLFARKAHTYAPPTGAWADAFDPHADENQGPGWTSVGELCDGWGPGCGGWGPIGDFGWVGSSWPDHSQPGGMAASLISGWISLPATWFLTGYPTDIDLWFADQLTEVNAQLRVNTATVAQTIGHFHPSTVFEWSASSGTFSGAGQRVNWTPDTVGTATIEVCADRPVGATLCLAKDFTVIAAQPEVTIESVTTLLDLGFGRFATVSGRLEGAAYGTADVVLFKHTDLHYLDNAAVTLNPDGTFSATPFLMDNITRINVMAKDPTTVISSLTNCTSEWCRGTVDPESGRNYPVMPDGNDVFDVDVHYLQVSSHVDPAIALLEDRRAPIPVLGTTNAYLYRSSAESREYYLYDQATVAIGLVAAGDTTRAGALLDGLAAAQLSDGSWPFLMLQNGDPYWAEGDIRYAGANSWTVMAFNAYHLATGTTTYSTVVADALDYLDGQRHSDGIYSPVRFNPSNLNTTDWDERDINSFEHNADALSAFGGHAQVLGYESHPGTIADLTAWLWGRWNGAYFNAGTHSVYGDNERERYLDTQTWGLLALGAGSPLLQLGLQNDCTVFFDTAGHVAGLSGLQGFSDFAWSTGELPHGPFIWSEGTLGFIAALDEVYRKTGTNVVCEGYSANDLYSTMTQMLNSAQLPTATANAHPEYTEIPGTAALAWWLMVDAEYNPFRPWETP